MENLVELLELVAEYAADVVDAKHDVITGGYDKAGNSLASKESLRALRHAYTKTGRGQWLKARERRLWQMADRQLGSVRP